MRLNDMRPGETAYLVSLAELDQLDAQRFTDLGLTPGEKITLVQRAPLGDPVWIELRGYQLAFRADLASLIIVSQQRGEVSG